MADFSSNKTEAKSKAWTHLSLWGWVSLASFARIIGVSYPTVLKMKNEGKIRTIRVGGVFRVELKEVERFVQEGNAREDEEEEKSTKQTKTFEELHKEEVIKKLQEASEKATGRKLSETELRNLLEANRTQAKVYDR